MGTIYNVFVHGARGETVVVDLCNTEEQMRNMTVLQLKGKIAQKLPATVGEKSLQLIFADKRLDGDDTPLSDYGIQHMSHIHLVVKMPGGRLAGRCC